jgi:tetratricopeptide (TPR) repeat protein
LKRKVAATPDGQRELLSTLRDLAESEKNDELEVAVTEQMVELNPGDASARFSLAFKHSQIGNNDMALYHYLKIPVSKRRPLTWNNVGAAYDEFGLRTKAVEAYRLSAEENETLAMANIGFKLLHLGFLHEAQQQADNAISIKPHHKNVADLVKRLSEIEDEEAAKLNEILEKVKAKAAFYRKIGAGILATSPRNIAAKWNSPDGILEAKLNGATVQFSGVFERSNPFAGILSQMGAVSNKSIYRVKVECAAT